MSKMKTHSGAKKRLKVLSSGRIKRKKANRRHLLGHKQRKRKLHLNDTEYVLPCDYKRISRCLNV
ncbi:MAG: 50S ribosomal protein L35 [Bdellovibrionales bacterium]